MPSRPYAVRATAPVRVADVGGWTDTWFGGPGRVCHLAVGPGVEVRARRTNRTGGAPSVVLESTALDPPVTVTQTADGRWAGGSSVRHLMLEEAVCEVLEGVPADEVGRVEVVIGSQVPPGASLGTSAAVVVSLLAALDTLLAGGRRTPEELAVLAHRVETVRARREAGVQDQWAAAVGGASLLEVDPYPTVRRTPIPLSDAVVAELGQRLVTVVFAPHDSSAVHREVIGAHCPRRWLDTRRGVTRASRDRRAGPDGVGRAPRCRHRPMGRVAAGMHQLAAGAS
ncbi:hypothetical protein [Knoellia remsis]|uniref:GHMP family kinase ATP-binding protein n=1 Tax=Knoellia remsis TaxID=407159 RepID=UPI0011B278B0|nr:hypothetical protein [Knoellia remsis]